ncbi:PAP2 superfamily protein [Paramicrobacterium humi]|uniref:PAP2 superfamily protein n=1 Tax=Paramicrobacterium humi TaxID=640635 RepID=A0A1H4L515_9MICO|nr:phosphatase PAP2 family protein [Microbacterium humi]SEB65566.1 PAP2 superfamily protein [Microbacterium humi]
MSILVRSCLVALGGVIGVIASFAFGVLTPVGQSVEQRVLDSSSYAEHSPLLAVVTVPNLAIACAVVVLIAIVRRRWADAAVAALLLVASNLLGQLLKYRVLDRPPLTSDSLDAANTFPSGHTIAFASVLIGLVIVVPPVLRAILAPIVALVLGAVAVQLLAFGWHRPSDIVGGVCLVVAIAGVLMALRTLRTPRVRMGRNPARPVGRVLLGVGVLAGIAAGVLAGLLSLNLLDDGWPVRALAFGVGVATVCVGVGAVLWMLPAVARRR